MNVFDIIGPVMIGPSSSHTAGAVRLGRVAWKILGERAVKAQIQLSGSFAHTYRGHGTDKALIAGIMGMHSDDERIRRSLSIAQEEGLLFSFTEEDIPGAHPNTARISLEGENGAGCVIPKKGGEAVMTIEVDGDVSDNLIQSLRILPNVINVVLIRAI